ncbi:MAG: hypothetical protein BMS9Abin07_0967 [Acidimicrobiia bacterium]|nr:MAG: hypothetical protein BMS9Abin07_0967 [Acidimicrobiia bacterium]
MEGMDFSEYSIDELEQFVTGIERVIGRGRAAQMAVLREVDRRQVPVSDGCRSLTEWVTGRLDVAPDTAKTLVNTARRLDELSLVEQAAAAGELTFDRTIAVARLAQAGDEEAVLEGSAGFDVAGIHRQAAYRRRMSRNQEHQGFQERYMATQSNLDHTALQFHGRVLGVASRIVEEALHSIGDTLPDAPGVPRSRTTRNADALWKMAQDALNGATAGNGATPQVTVFVDAALAATTGGETGVTVASGPRVGPATLEAVICSGSVEVLSTTANGTPLNIGRAGRVVSGKLRRFVLHRDAGACTADGCTSRYRLESHHITPWARGGSTDADNLTTLLLVPPSRHRSRRRFLHRPRLPTPPTPLLPTALTRPALGGLRHGPGCSVTVDALVVVNLPAMPADTLAASRRALADCDAVVDRLHEMCCQPDRSPRMLAIKEDIALVRAEIEASSDDTEALERALSTLTDIGEQFGYLQVSCCAPARMPLYADALSHLNVAQRKIKRSAGKGH